MSVQLGVIPLCILSVYTLARFIRIREDIIKKVLRETNKRHVYIVREGKE